MTSATPELPAPIERTAKLAALGYALVAVALGFAIHDLSHANRPHELKWFPLVITLALAGTALGVAVTVGLAAVWRRRSTRRFRLRELLLVGVSAVYALVVLGYWGFVGALTLVSLLD